jgi:hypothetical protein
MKRRKTKEMTGEEFDALSEHEKERIFQELENKTTEQLIAESRPLNKKERAEWRQIKRKIGRPRIGRPRIGRGTTNISVSLEKSLVKAADRFAMKHGMSRSQLIARGVRAIIGSAA